MPQLPISNALTEATPDSISDLFNRDPETLNETDLDRLIAEMRSNRERYEAAEAAGVKQTRTARGSEKDLREAVKAFSQRHSGGPDIRPLPVGKI